MPLLYQYRESDDSSGRTCDRRAIEFLVAIGAAAPGHQIKGPGIPDWTPLAEAMPLEWPETAAPGDWAGVVRKVMPSVPVVISPVGAGSGVVVREDGLVLTNRHVVEHGTTARLRFRSGEYPAVVVKIAEDRDLALVKTYGTPVELVNPLRFDVESAGPGTAILAVGHPSDYEETVTRGIVSAIREVSLDPYPSQRYLQLDAAINPGNSGGPVLDNDGELIGLATWKRLGGESLRFPVPPDRITEFLIATLTEIDSGEIEIPTAQEVAAMPFSPTPLQSVISAIDAFPGKVRIKPPAEDETPVDPNLREWLLTTDRKAELLVRFIQPNESLTGGYLAVEFCAVGNSQISLLQDHRVLQSLLRYNDDTFSTKFLIRSNGDIILAAERSAIDLDPSEARQAIAEVIHETDRMVDSILGLRQINNAGPRLSDLKDFKGGTD